MSDDYNANFSFILNDEKDFKYSKNLLFLYKKLVLPFITENYQKLQNLSDWFVRFFYINGFNITDGSRFGYKGYVGKSFFNTKTSRMMVNPHLPDGDRADIETHYISHFRNRYILGSHDRSIRFFNIDLNYFNCIIKPYLHKLNSINLNS